MALNVPRLACVALASAVIGTLLDKIHTAFDVLRYAHPCFGKQSCLVPVIMGGAGAAVVLTSALYRVLLRRPAVGTTAAVVISGVAFAGAYLASGLLQEWPLGLLGAYVLVLSVTLVARPRLERTALVATAIVVGTTAELVLTQCGFFTYPHPNLFGLPYWIGGLYGFAGLTGMAVEERWPVTGPSLGAPLNA